MTIFLCGFMGCGKTTVGKLAAKKLGCNFYDTDDLIVEQQNMSIPTIFKEKGEPFFRNIEAQVIQSLCGKKAVISCGGGAMLNPDSAKSAAKAGAVVFIDVDFETCYERICGDGNRPIATTSTKEELLQRFNYRREIYMKHATIHIDGNGSPIEIADLISNSVKRI